MDSELELSSKKKQKGRETKSIDLIISSTEGSSHGPVFALFPAVKPPKSTPFTLYTTNGLIAPIGESSLVVGETEEMEYESRNQLGLRRAKRRQDNDGGDDDDDEENFGNPSGNTFGEESGCSVQYMLGVHNPRTNTLTLHSAPVHSITSTVKRLKREPQPLTPQQITVQRSALGLAFGTKKAQSAQSRQARNKLDANSYGNSKGLSSLLQESISIATASLPTALAVELQANLSRPIPPPNFEATTPEEVYKLDDIVTPSELESIDLNLIMEGKTQKERNQFLPYRRSSYVATKMRQLFPISDLPTKLNKKDQKKLKLLIHLTHLLAFRQASVGKNSNLTRTILTEKMGEEVSPIILDSLLERYTEEMKGKGGEMKRKITVAMEVKILSYFLVLILKLDNYGTDVGTIAADLSLGQKRVQELFKSLGCTLVAPNTAERERLVSTGQATNLVQARKSKRAVLKVPLVFPRETRGQPKR